MKKKLLWVGDACVSSGFAKCTHKTIEGLREDFDVTVLGMNYLGDPHTFPYEVYPCYPGGDAFGVGRLPNLVAALNPDVVVLQNDPWNMPAYIKGLRSRVPWWQGKLVGAIAVDGKNMKTAEELNEFDGAMFWTHFGLEQARLGGYTKPACVIPLGVDLDMFNPMDRVQARMIMDFPPDKIDLDTAFVVGNVNRNQPRKRLDLTVAYFCEWVKSRGIDDAFLHLHVAPTGDQGWDVKNLMKYHGIKGRLILMEPHIGQGSPEEKVALTYSCFDAMLTTTQGEGWGLTTLEGMACGIPQIVPAWSALGEWCGDAVIQIPCDAEITTPNFINVIGGIPNKAETLAALDLLYYDREARTRYSHRALSLAQRPEYRWDNIGARFNAFVKGIVTQ